VSATKTPPEIETWIGRLPSHWGVMPLFALFVERGETNDGYKTSNVLSVLKDVGVINYEDKGDIGNKKSEDIERYKIVHVGDIVVNSMNVIIGSVGVSREYGSLSPVYIVLKPRNSGNLDVRYYGYVFSSRDFQRWLTRIGYGILAHRMRIPIDNLKREQMPFPPRDEQTKIADFLDHETAEMSALISKYERLLDLLEEKRAALFTRAVTRGFDTETPLKDSGVEWIGRIPEHWKCVSTSTLYEVSLGKMLDEKQRSGEHLIPYLRVADVQWDSINVEDLPTIDIREDEYRRYLLAPGDLLINEGGSYPGRSAIWNGEIEICTFQKALHRLRPRSQDAYPAFMALVMRVVTDSKWLLADQGRSTIAHIPAEDMKRLRVPCPPRREQESIVAALKVEASEIEALRSRITRAIDIARERRFSLITAVVTGQIEIGSYRESRMNAGVAV
jgi:type I restriction enzyme, S subunit